MVTAAGVRPDTTMGRALAARALRLEATHTGNRLAASSGLLNLTQPESVLLPEHIRQAAKDALDRGETHYTVRPGVPELRAAIARQLDREGFSASVDRTVITNGGAEALYIALQATLKPGHRAAVLGPVDPGVLEMIRFIGAEVHVAAGDPENRFIPSPEDFSSIEAGVLILASPSPITGVAIPSAALEAIVSSAVERGVSVILDRTHSSCLYQPEVQPFRERALTENFFLIGSFSVSHALRGWQVGYFVSPEQRIAELRGLKQAMSICTTAVSQFTALAALEEPTDWFDGRRRELRARRDSVIAELQAAGLAVLAPDAYPPLMIDTRPIASDDRSVVEYLRGSGVAVEPGSRFGPMTAGFIRIDLSCDAEVLDKGIRRIVALADDGNSHG